MVVPVPDQLEYISDADGVTKDFPYPKRFLQKDEIVVLLRNADGVDTPQILNTHYTIAGSSWPNGGTISFNVAPASGLKVVRYRMTQAKQTVDLKNNQRNDAPSVELQLDRLTMAIQDRGRLGEAAWWGLLAETAARVHSDKLLNSRVDQEIIDRENGDKAIASLIGQAGDIEVPMYDTRLAVTFAKIKPTINTIRTGGYDAPGDGGAALYTRVAAEPSHAGKVQSADGVWWEEVKRSGTLSFWSNQRVPERVSSISTTGFAQDGDGGGALYKRVSVEPSHAGKFQTEDGAWWEEVKQDGSRAFWMTQRVPFTVSAIRTTGYNSEGDLGDALYKRVSSQPAHAGWFQSADGAYWELAQTDIRAAVFGAFPGTNATVQLQNALTFLRLKGGGHLFVDGGIYEITSTLSIGSNTTFQMDPGAAIRRMANIDCMILSYSDGTQGGYSASKDITIEGGTWDHNAPAYPAAGSTIAFGHCNRPVVRNTTVLNVSGRWHAIECNACTRAIFENNYFDGGGNDEVGGECIQIDGAYEGGAFPWYGPYDNTTCYDITIRNNRIQNWASGIGSHSAVGSGRHENIKIHDNEIRFSRYGIAVFNWAGAYIKGNRILGTMAGAGGNQYGIYCYPSGNDVSDIIITQNTILDIVRDTSQVGGSRGIFFFGTLANPFAMRNIRITENYIQGVGRHGIVLEGCTSYVVENNIVTSFGSRGVYIYGSAQGTVRGNRVSSGAADPAIDVGSVGGANATSNIVTDNIVTGASGGIRVSSNWVVVVNNITPALQKTGAGGILGPNWVNGALVAS